MLANIVEKSNDASFAVTDENMFNNKSNVDDDTNWMLTSIMQIDKLKEEWNLEAEEEQAPINVCDISKDKITVSQIQELLTSTQVKLFDSDTCYHISPYYNIFSNILAILP